jgi:hypothetical protein
MFIRARPLIDEQLIKSLFKKINIVNALNDDNLLYFNSGSAALKWFLLNIGNQNLKVGVQAYTCSSVLDAITESENIPVFLDTDKSCLSTTFDKVVGFSESIDILIVTHLFCIPNPDYLRIIDWANSNNIIVIDDLAQSYKSTYYNSYIENYSQFYFYSFSYDKPLTCFNGGCLKIDKDDIFKLKIKYASLNRTSNWYGKLSLKKLILYYKLTDPIFYKNEFRFNTILENILLLLPIRTKLELKIIFLILNSKFNKIFTHKIFKQKKTIKCKKLSLIQISYIQNLIKNNFELNFGNYEKLKKCIRKIDPDVFFFEYYDLNKINCLRIPILTKKRDLIINKLRELGIESGNHNWPHLLEYNKYFKGSIIIAEEVVNLPVWSDAIWNNSK